LLQLIVAATVNLLVYSLPKLAKPENKKGKQKAKALVDLKLIKTVQLPVQVGGAEDGTFRVARSVLLLTLP